MLAVFKGAVIDNTRLPKNQELQLLEPYLTGDADKLLHKITITDDNFDILKKSCRIDTKNCLIVRSNLLEIFEHRSLTTENSKDLQTLIETTEEHQTTLRYRRQAAD